MWRLRAAAIRVHPHIFGLTGELEGLFMADCGLTCCQFAGAGKESVLMAGSDGGHVHILELPAIAAHI